MHLLRMLSNSLLIGVIATSSSLALPAAKPITAPSLKEGKWDTLKLTWDKPEQENSYSGNPIGNGFIGAKIKGGVETEIYQLNDKTFWSGGTGDIHDPKRLDAMKITREKLAANDIPGANDTARGMWGPVEPGTYLPLGNLVLKFAHGDAATDYLRTLDIDQALSTVKYRIGSVEYTREAFASFPDKVIVTRLTSNSRGKLAFTASLANPLEMKGHGSIALEGKDTIVMRGKAPTLKTNVWEESKGMTHEGRVRIIPTGGRMTNDGTSLRVEGADSVILLFADATSYSGFDKDPVAQGVNPTPLVKTALAAASAKTYDQLFAAHLKDYQSIFRRLSVEINGEQPNKYALGYQYARYDMIAASRTGDRPHNQQGMWNHMWRPMSNSCHFLNENVEKYYALIETGNIADCGEPLWNWMGELAISGRKTAKEDWGFNGWLAPHYSDIWATTTLKGGNNEWSIWPMGGIWLCQNLWDHYAFSQDKEFLRTRAYPILKGAAEFALDLLADDGKGHLVTSPSTSPENQFRLVEGGPTYAVSQGSTMDMALIRELFQNCITASTTLNVDPDFKAKLTATLPKLLPFQIGANGELQEWSQDFVKRDNGHRHASHVVAVWPLRQITERGTPELFQAAKLALDNRGGGGYHPDKAAMYAHLKDGDKSLTSKDGYYTGGGLAGQFPPKYSSFAELLLQSHTSELELLPALPSSWTSGKIDGIRARGGYELSIEWSGGQLTKCRILSPLGTTPVVRYKGELLNLLTDQRLTLVK